MCLLFYPLLCHSECPYDSKCNSHNLFFTLCPLLKPVRLRLWPPFALTLFLAVRNSRDICGHSNHRRPSERPHSDLEVNCYTTSLGPVFSSKVKSCIDWHSVCLHAEPESMNPLSPHIVKSTLADKTAHITVRSHSHYTHQRRPGWFAWVCTACTAMASWPQVRHDIAAPDRPDSRYDFTTRPSLGW